VAKTVLEEAEAARLIRESKLADLPGTTTSVPVAAVIVHCVVQAAHRRHVMYVLTDRFHLRRCRRYDLYYAMETS
jgi:hypothetical protein